MVRVVLYRPEIPQNTGNIARTCAATRTPLHLIRPLGFHLSDRHLKRAGLDYWPYVDLHIHESFSDFLETVRPGRCVLFSTRGKMLYTDWRFNIDDCLVFGSETSGLPRELLEDPSYPVIRIPHDRSRVRSLNLSTAVGIALYEALRQLEFGTLFAGICRHEGGGHGERCEGVV
ncbi:tRNA (cytidine(34)-2'-O)-methyltransferase [Thermodesulforhabdus norvegica]|uniref:Putative tRNA (cytidine(34)-2'-O)-methyltransferase n=1 Tax=Thermodesulforhabdus norvegica TaxID=39841 RepID=A0A1I4SLE6_9BACT|nr:tRNA (cytidine(34)-2'-O)-methyltransferase [Thermodesulforhabdus norvegica]SFM65237.1 tRNA (cytidine/uridine-2'-O-)-methyltransferase [Thermodesulforhabdus norvegica]